tara:strand:+ start:119 stop:388 length:270 start_codon:yes stop_codon:yes gene_type:complete
MEEIKNEFVMTNCNCKDIVYHKICLEKWLGISNSCPFCKKEYNISPYEAKNDTSLLEKAIFLDSINRFPSHDLDNSQIDIFYNSYNINS